jgi:hypothetical protein
MLTSVSPLTYIIAAATKIEKFVEVKVELNSLTITVRWVEHCIQY